MQHRIVVKAREDQQNAPIHHRPTTHTPETQVKTSELFDNEERDHMWPYQQPSYRSEGTVNKNEMGEA